MPEPRRTVPYPRALCGRPERRHHQGHHTMAFYLFSRPHFTFAREDEKKSASLHFFAAYEDP